MYSPLWYLLAILIATALLQLGRWLCRVTTVFQRLYVPGSVIAGFLGLSALAPSMLLVNDDARLLVSDSAETFVRQLHQVWSGWPSLLISVVFAALLLESPSRSFRQSARTAWQEGLVVWLIVLGQTTVGIWLTWLVLKPVFGMPHSFAMLIETGFAGGHGTAAAMGQVFASPAVQLQHGDDLGMMMATVGLISSVTTGILYINIAARMRWVSSDVSARANQGSANIAANKSAQPQAPPSVWLLQVIWLGLAVACGHALHYVVELTVNAIPAASAASESQGVTAAEIIGSFPLFIYTLFGGLITRHLLVAFKCGHLIQAPVLQRIVGVAMDYLVVAAIATLNVLAVASSAAPLVILIVGGLLWSAFCLFFVSRWLLPRDYWLPLGLINYGMSTGTTATGFVLLRLVDPELKTRAAEDYALAAPISAPFVGGGMLTLALPILVLERTESLMAPALISALALVVIGFIARSLRGFDDGPTL